MKTMTNTAGMRKEFMGKKIFLVDTENEGGKKYINILQSGLGENKMYLFFTENTVKIDMSCFQAALKYPGQIVAEKCNPGKNGLDFQLCSMLGYLIATEDKENEYLILSNDTGYDPCVAFWKEKGSMVSRLAFSNTPTEVLVKKSTDQDPETETTVLNVNITDQKKLQSYLSGVSKPEAEKRYKNVIRFMKHSKAKSDVEKKVVLLLKSKKLEGYDPNLLAQICVIRKPCQQELLSYAFGKAKALEFFNKTSKAERKRLAA